MGRSQSRLHLVVKASPLGGAASFGVNGTNAAKYTTVTFAKAGTYQFSVRIVDAGGRSVSSVKSVLVSQTFTSVNLRTASGQLVSPGSTVTVPGVSQAFAAQGLDQFGSVLAKQPTFTWSVATVPSGATLAHFGRARCKRYGDVRKVGGL